MSAAYFIIAILGCGESDAACATVKTLDARYESQAACIEASEAAASRHSDVDFPVVVAQCVAAGSSPAPVAPSELKLPEGGKAPAANSPVRSRRS